jgi:hypothetical protein
MVSKYLLIIFVLLMLRWSEAGIKQKSVLP